MSETSQPHRTDLPTNVVITPSPARKRLLSLWADGSPTGNWPQTVGPYRWWRGGEGAGGARVPGTGALSTKAASSEPLAFCGGRGCYGFSKPVIGASARLPGIRPWRAEHGNDCGANSSRDGEGMQECGPTGYTQRPPRPASTAPGSTPQNGYAPGRVRDRQTDPPATPVTIGYRLVRPRDAAAAGR
jgi:hypothetical protein